MIVFCGVECFWAKRFCGLFGNVNRCVFIIGVNT